MRPHLKKNSLRPNSITTRIETSTLPNERFSISALRPNSITTRIETLNKPQIEVYLIQALRPNSITTRIETKT